MKPYFVDYHLEQYVPEYKAYLETGIYTQQEVDKIIKLREKYERRISESFAPSLKDYCDYLTHLAATSKLSRQRYQSSGQQVDPPPQFRIPVQQYTRIVNSALRNHKNNYKAYTWLTNFAVQHNSTNLINIITDKFLKLHPHFYLPWLFKAKAVELQASLVDCRRIYNQATFNIRPFAINYGDVDEIHLTRLLEPEEQLRQRLPDDALPVFYNWFIMELSFISGLVGDQNITWEGLRANEGDSDEERAMKQLLQGGYLVLVVTRALQFIARCGGFGQPSPELLVSGCVGKLVAELYKIYEERVGENNRLRYLNMDGIVFQGVVQLVPQPQDVAGLAQPLAGSLERGASLQECDRVRGLGGELDNMADAEGLLGSDSSE